MSLLLNLREWITFDDAIKRANQRAVFAANMAVGLWTEDALEPYRQQLLHACSDEGVMLRFYGEADTIVTKPKKWADRFVSNYSQNENLTDWHEGLLGYHKIVLHESCLKQGDVYVLEEGQSVKLYFHDSDESDNKGVPCCFTAEWRQLLSPYYRKRLEVHRPSLDAMLDKAISNANPQTIAAADGADEILPPKTAATFFKEYKAMAETIAKLANRKAISPNELATVVIDECEKAGYSIPVEQRTVKSRIEKA